jgi:AraC-like DNA-binding protein
MKTTLIVIGLLAVGQGLLLAYFLGSKRTNLKANRLLASLFALFCIYVLAAVSGLSGTFRDLPHTIGITYPFPLLFGPVWYLYTRLLTSPERQLSQKDALHFLPALAGFVQLTPYLLKSAEWKIGLMEGTRQIPADLIAGSFLMSVHGLVYLSMTLVLLRRHVVRLLDLFSDLQRKDLRWLRTITLIIGLIWLLITGLQVLRLSGADVPENLGPVGGSGVAVLILVTGYLGLRQTEIFDAVPHRVEPQPAGETQEGGYKKPGLTTERRAEILEYLRVEMEEKRSYLKPSLTLRDLAQRLSVSEHHLSEAVNTGLGKSFFDMVNGYRVEEVKRRLQDPKNSSFTLTAIGFDAGFSSKSSFNEVFRKMTGTTPSSFRQQSSSTTS